MSVDRCVCCGEVIAEGRMLCKRCEVSADDVIRQLTAGIAELEKTVKYHETTIHMILADAEAEKEKARAEAETSVMYGDSAEQQTMYQNRLYERKEQKTGSGGYVIHGKSSCENTGNRAGNTPLGFGSYRGG